MLFRRRIPSLHLEQHTLLLKSLGHVQSLFGDVKRLTRTFAIVKKGVVKSMAEGDTGRVHYSLVFLYADYMVGPSFQKEIGC